MKILALEYTGYKFDEQINLGDEIQTIAAKALLPKIDGYVSREALDKVQEPAIVSLNGFFMGSKNWPPSKAVIPILYSFHIAKKYEETICSPDGLVYLKKFEPIGCRDRGTQKILEKYGINAFYSKCLTLTFDRRDHAPSNGKTYIVGVNKNLSRVIPDSIARNAIFVNQSKLQLPFVPTELKQELATNLLDSYKSSASLVITSKIHCAMPCIAMGIPVVFLYDSRKKSDYRVKIIDDLVGINYVNESLLFSKLICKHLSKKINWSPEPIDIEDEKLVIKNKFLEAFQRARQNFEKFYSDISKQA